MFLLPITALSMARGKAGGPLGPAMLVLSTCGVKTRDGEAESETWHGSMLFWGWFMGGCIDGCMGGGVAGVGEGVHPPVLPLILFWLSPLTLH